MLKNPGATAFAYDSHVVAVVKLVRPQEKLVIRQLVLALPVYTFKPYLLKVLRLKLVDHLEVANGALAGGRVVLG